MVKLPVIVGFGGINAAGRSSGHNGYRRMIIDALAAAEANQIRASLAALTGQLHKHGSNWIDAAGDTVDLQDYIRIHGAELERGSLIRRVEKNLFDPDHLLFHKKASLAAANGEAFKFEIAKKQVPHPLPSGWSIHQEGSAGEGKISISAGENLDVLLRSYRSAKVNSAGQLPTGFDPATL